MYVNFYIITRPQKVLVQTDCYQSDAIHHALVRVVQQPFPLPAWTTCTVCPPRTSHCTAIRLPHSPSQPTVSMSLWLPPPHHRSYVISQPLSLFVSLSLSISHSFQGPPLTHQHPSIPVGRLKVEASITSCRIVIAKHLLSSATLLLIQRPTALPALAHIICGRPCNAYQDWSSSCLRTVIYAAPPLYQYWCETSRLKTQSINSNCGYSIDREY